MLFSSSVFFGILSSVLFGMYISLRTSFSATSNPVSILLIASRLSLAENITIVQGHFQSIAKLLCDFCEERGMQKPSSVEHVLCSSINKKRGHGLLFWFIDSVNIPPISGNVLVVEDGHLRLKDESIMDSEADIEFCILQPRFQHRKKIRLGYGFTGLGMETGAKVSARAAAEVALENLEKFNVLPYSEQLYLSGLLSDDMINNPPEVLKCRSFRLSPVLSSTTKEDIELVINAQFFKKCEDSERLSEYARILPDAGSHQPKDVKYSSMILEFKKTSQGEARLHLFREGIQSSGYLQLTAPSRYKTKITPLGQEAAGMSGYLFHT